MATATTPRPNESAGLARWPSLPTHLMNLFFATANDDTSSNNVNKHAAKVDSHLTNNQSALKRPVLSMVQFDDSPNPVSPSRSSSIMFAEPETRSNSDDCSREGSIDGLRRAKRSARPKTQFSICHPPPESKTRQKLHRRPRSLLQLHRLSANARPLPALEVIPSANFSVRLTRAITRVFKAKHGLCGNDLVVLKAEKYSKDQPDEEREAQDVIGLICKGRINEDKTAGKVRIHMVSGREWEAYPAVNGGYEFFSTDEHGLGLTVRWVPKRAKDGNKGKVKDGKRRFNFSTISPNSRKHPVIASLSGSGLDINDSYKIPEPASVTPLSSPGLNGSFPEDTMDDDVGGMDQCETDERLREIITLTAIYVTFKEGWSPNYKYDEKEKDTATSPVRTGTFSTPPGSPTPYEKRSSLKSISSGIIRRSSVLSRSNRSSTASVPEEDEPDQAPSRSGSFSGRTGRSRANSSSTVLVHRAASNRRKNNSQAAWRPDLLPSQDPLQETSREDLSRDVSSPLKSPSPLARTDSSPVQARDSKPQPIIPDDTGSGAQSPSPRSRTPVDKLELPKEHRESLATTDTSASTSPAGKSLTDRPKAKKTKRKRKAGWRKMLCGSSSPFD